MEDYGSSDEDTYSSDQESYDGLENEETDSQWGSSTGNSCKVL